jgi:hypothetical protein
MTKTLAEYDFTNDSEIYIVPLSVLFSLPCRAIIPHVDALCVPLTRAAVAQWLRWSSTAIVQKGNTTRRFVILGHILPASHMRACAFGYGEFRKQGVIGTGPSMQVLGDLEVASPPQRRVPGRPCASFCLQYTMAAEQCSWHTMRTFLCVSS